MSVEGFLKKQKLFGRSHAVTVEAQANREGYSTLGLEFAKTLEGEGRYDWDNKLIIQLKPDHLPLYTAVLCGDLSHLRLDHYGAERNKSLEMETHPDGIVAIKGFSDGRGHAVPAIPERAFWLSAQALSCMAALAGHGMDAITLKANVRCAAQRHQLFKQRKQNQRGGDQNN